MGIGNVTFFLVFPDSLPPSTIEENIPVKFQKNYHLTGFWENKSVKKKKKMHQNKTLIVSHFKK